MFCAVNFPWNLLTLAQTSLERRKNWFQMLNSGLELITTSTIQRFKRNMKIGRTKNNGPNSS